MICTFVGFGALAREIGLTLGHAAFSSVSIFALPNQVVMADQIGHGATFATVFFAVFLAGIRLLPLTVSLLPVLKEDRSAPGWLWPLIVHFVAITVWVESMRHLPKRPPHLRIPYYLGFAMALMAATLLGTVSGYQLSANVPPAVAAVLLFLTPIYFILSLIIVADAFLEKTAIILGVVFGPLFFYVMPGFDLLLTGLIGGTLAYGGATWANRRD
ncbi:MAG: AzlC family ABC transporter permease [Methyloligellaceae bacterium]